MSLFVGVWLGSHILDVCLASEQPVSLSPSLGLSQVTGPGPTSLFQPWEKVCPSLAPLLLLMSTVQSGLLSFPS